MWMGILCQLSGALGPTIRGGVAYPGLNLDEVTTLIANSERFLNLTHRLSRIIYVPLCFYPPQVCFGVIVANIC